MHISSTLSILATSLLLLSTTTALPTKNQDKRPCDKNETRKDSLSSCPLVPAASLPESGLVPTSLTLRYVVLGKGTQNYTCASAGSAPVSAGAVAALYDISCQVTDPKSRSNLVEKVIPDILNDFSKPVQELLPSKSSAPGIGDHFFRDGTTAMFVLNDGYFIASGRLAGVPAPASAAGNENGAAVDWLKLARKTGEVNGGIEEVFRVHTAGGRAPATCSTAGLLTVNYVAEYWMYG